MRKALRSAPPPAGTRARGFTLIELTVAIAILGMLAATVYLALGGALSAAERTKRAQEPYQRGRVARGFLASALRSTAPFAGFPHDGFVAVDSTVAGMPRDELTFVAIAPAGAGSSRMQLHLRVQEGEAGPELRLGVRDLPPTWSDLGQFRTTVLTRGVAGMQVDYLGGPTTSGVDWVERWESRIRLPHAVRITFLPAERSDPMYLAPLVVSIPSGRIL